jgi:hypothetical protein
MPGLVPGILDFLFQDVDSRDIGGKTRFALWPGYDGTERQRQ